MISGPRKASRRYDVPAPSACGATKHLATRSRRALRRIAGIFGAIGLCFAATAQAQTYAPLAQRYAVTLPGDLIMLANAVMTCQTPPCPATNDSVVMINSKLPADAADGTVFNSSSSDLTAAQFPAGATIVKAMLYWGGIVPSSVNAATPAGVPVPNPATTTIKFATPGSAYTNLAADACAVSSPQINVWQTPWQFIYQCHADVTASVAAVGVGTYKAANIPFDSGQKNRYAGWSLVLVIRKPAGTLRNFTISDGLSIISTTGSMSVRSISDTVTGFTTPPSGTVNAQIGIVGYDGDKGAVDGLLFQGQGAAQVNLTDACNPVGDAFNSSICYLGTPVTTRSIVNSNGADMLGYDADIIQLSNASNANLGNGVSSATITANTTSEGYFIGVITTAIDVYQAAFDGGSAKTQKNITRPGLAAGQAYAGDVIEYDINSSNVGQDNATNLVLTDTIPANTTYVPNSLAITSGANAGAKTDAAGDDQAEETAAPAQTTFRLGVGADSTSGGLIRCTTCVGAQPTSSAVSYQVKINPAAAGGSVITNSANLNFHGQTSNQDYTARTNTVSLTLISQTNVKIAKSDDHAGAYTPGGSANYTITISNGGPDTAIGAVVSDPLPNGVTLTGAWTCSSATACHGCTPNGAVCTGGGAGAGNGADVLGGLSVDVPAGGAITVKLPVQFSSTPANY